MKKIIIFGNQQICIDCIGILNRLHKLVEIAAVVGCETHEDRNIGYPSLTEYCNKKNILFYNPIKLDKNFLDIIRKHEPDICFSIYYRNIFGPEFLRIPSMGFINFHSSLLPKYRGRTPTLWALLNNEDTVGITLHYVDTGIDTGDIIAQSEYKIPNNMSGYDLNSIIMKKGVELFGQQLHLILKGRNKRIKQNHDMASYYGQFIPQMRIINWYLPVVRIQRQIQALTKPYQGAKTMLSDMEVIIWKAQIINHTKKILSGPGKIIKIYKNKTFIVTGVDGHLLITDYVIPNLAKDQLSGYIAAKKRFALL